MTTIVINSRGDMEQLAKELGVNCFKLFMSQKGRLMLDNAELMEAFKHIKDIGGVAKVSSHPSSTPTEFGLLGYMILFLPNGQSRQF